MPSEGAFKMSAELLDAVISICHRCNHARVLLVVIVNIFIYVSRLLMQIGERVP